MCLAGAVIASWSLAQEVTGGRFEPFYCKIFSDKYLLSLNSAINSVKTFRDNSNVKQFYYNEEFVLHLFTGCGTERLEFQKGSSAHIRRKYV